VLVAQAAQAHLEEIT
jgi:hypothetical protein